MKYISKAYHFFFLGILLVIGVHLRAGSVVDPSNLRQKSFVAVNDTVHLDSSSLIPNSVVIEGMDSINYEINYAGAFLVLKDSSSFSIQYRTFPVKFDQVYQHKIPAQNQGYKQVNPYQLRPQSFAKTQDVFGESQLNKSGSISRGINIGNTRDLSVNSNMNLQLSGMVQDIEISASITDNNIPIQPDGNTQQLQDFDQVFVKFKKGNHALVAGDYTISEKEDAFLRFNKKAQGVNYSGNFKGNGKRLNTQFSAALSRGKFARNLINGVEGNQGPYQLRGAENESFIIILSGTERVFIDGQLLTRGMENDYVIDYNAAEITFTSNQLITKDKRIIVEFQYSDKNYSRTLFQFSNDIHLSKKTSLTFNAYSEQDMKFQQILQTLDQDDLNLLNSVGDSVQQAITERIDLVEYSDELTLYRKVDTTVNSTIYTAYVFSNDPELARYQMTFSNVGHNNGDYVQDNSGLNGRIFRWVAPINGIKQGDFAPYIKLIAPKQKQMLSAKLKHQFNASHQIQIESAISNDNKNLFSKLDKQDDQGLAVKAKYLLSKEFGKEWQVQFAPQYQLVSSRFSRIERFRSVEFKRDWNLDEDDLIANEHQSRINFHLKKNKQERVKLESSYLSRNTQYEGSNHKLELNTPLWNGGNLKGSGSILNSTDPVTRTSFLRHNVELAQKIKFIEFKVFEKTEQKLIKLNGYDSLLLSSSNDYYHYYGGGIKTDSKKALSIEADVKRRFDYLPVQREMFLATSANEYVFGLVHQNKKKTSYLKLKSTYRQLSIEDSSLSSLNNENTLLNRIEYNFKLFKGMIRSKTFYEIGTGNELKRSFSYVEVNPGQGLYAWIDFDGDGLQDLNEFVTTEFADQRNYLRVYLPTTEFIETNSNQITQSFNINPSQWFNRKTRVGKLITRFNNQTLLRLKQKNEKTNGSFFHLPTGQSIVDSSLISSNTSFRNTIYFNRSNRIFGLNYTFSNNTNKNLLLHGYDARQLQSNAFDLRLNFLKRFTLLSKAERQIKQRRSEVFKDDDYQLSVLNVSPKLQYQTSAKWRVTFLSSYKHKSNVDSLGGERSELLSAGLEFNYAIPGKGRMNIDFNYIKNTLLAGESDNNSSPLLFDMLEGLQEGSNFTWSFRYQQNFKNNLQASINYEGRSSPGFKVVHTGGVQVQMLF